jgi:4-hydroxy-tetrahydrodipicolinate synthase
MSSLTFQGVFTALVTPFTEDAASIDFDAYGHLLEMQVEGGVAGVVPCGTTGETPTLSSSEQLELVRYTKQILKGRLPIIVGAGSNDTQASVAACRAAVEAGADAVMVVMPYYNKPNQAGMLRHIELLCAAVDVPVVLYNIPARSGVELSAKSTLKALSTCPNVAAVKDATGKLNYSQQVLSQAEGRVSLLSGDDLLTLPLLAVGARGVISVASNLYPRAVVDVVNAGLAGDYTTARRAHYRLLPVYKALFEEPNPAPVKAALASKGLINEAVRPPIVSISDECRVRLLATLSEYEGASAA